MILIIGGAYQGKLAYAREHYAGMELENQFHLRLLELVKQGADPLSYVKAHLPELAEKVIISDDVFCGIVPADPLLRKWREEAGRTLALLAKESTEVVRVFCGLGTKIK